MSAVSSSFVRRALRFRSSAMPVPLTRTLGLAPPRCLVMPSQSPFAASARRALSTTTPTSEDLSSVDDESPAETPAKRLHMLMPRDPKPWPTNVAPSAGKVIGKVVDMKDRMVHVKIQGEERIIRESFRNLRNVRGTCGAMIGDELELLPERAEDSSGKFSFHLAGPNGDPVEGPLTDELCKNPRVVPLVLRGTLVEMEGNRGMIQLDKVSVFLADLTEYAEPGSRVELTLVPNARTKNGRALKVRKLSNRSERAPRADDAIREPEL